MMPDPSLIAQLRFGCSQPEGIHCQRERATGGQRAGVALLLAVGALLAAPSPARAHDAFEITTEAKVFPDRLQLHVAMSSRTASALCWGLGGNPNDFEQSDLDAFPERFRDCARGLYRVTSRAAPLSPTSVRVHLSVEHDFEASLVYPPPRPGPLRFEATHLARLRSPEYGAVLTAVAERVFLGQALLRADDPALEVELPPASQRATSPAPRARPSSRERAALSVSRVLGSERRSWLSLGALAAALLSGFVLVRSRLERSSRHRRRHRDSG